MDEVTRYRSILRRLARDYARFKPSHGKIEALAVCDPKTDNYVLLHSGWDNVRRVHAIVFHLRLTNGKVLIEEGGVEHGIAQNLLAAGVAPNDIVYSLEAAPQPAPRKPSRQAGMQRLSVPLSGNHRYE